MNLEEFRNALASDATEELKTLKNKLESCKREYTRKTHEYNEEKSRLLGDCRALANRCHALTLGTMCLFCELSEYQCQYALPLERRLKEAKKLMKEERKNRNA